MDDKIVFFSNESILKDELVLRHFHREHKVAMAKAHHVDFQCKKGRANPQNQDNFFIVIDGDIKIFGVFDGHGVQGHLVSGFVAGTMLDYIRNKEKIFHSKRIAGASDQDVQAALRRCFKHAQRKLKASYLDFLDD